MIANDFRIGNWVQCSGEYVYLTCISNEGISAQNDNSAYVFEGFDDFSVIPLTPEILEKCGFYWDKNWLKISLMYAGMELAFAGGANDKMTLFQKTPPFDNPVIVRLNFGVNFPKYLHQLQNLYFALTGNELEIKL